MNLDGLVSSIAGWRGYAVALVIGGVIGGLATGTVQGALYGARIANIEKTQADEKADQARVALAEIVRLQNLIAGIDADNLEKAKEHAQTVDKLRADVRAGVLRLSVRTAGTAAASAAGMGDGAARAELDPADAETLLGIADDGDRAIIKLTACQEYARAVSSPPANKSGDE